MNYQSEIKEIDQISIEIFGEIKNINIPSDDIYIIDLIDIIASANKISRDDIAYLSIRRKRLPLNLKWKSLKKDYNIEPNEIIKIILFSENYPLYKSIDSSSIRDKIKLCLC